MMSICCMFGFHRFRWVYKDPCSQHPVSVTRPNGKTVRMAGRDYDDIDLLTRCARCGVERWR
jgi:hypothetical protein